MTLPFLLEKEFKQISRNPTMVGIFIFFTLLVVGVFPWAVNFELKNVAVTVICEDTGTEARELIQKVQASPTFTISGLHRTYPPALGDINAGRASLILHIPDDFSSRLTTERHADVMLLANSVDASQASLAQGYLQELILQYADDIRTQKLGYSAKDLSPIDVVPAYRFNTEMDYKNYMLPAFVVMLLTMFCGIFTAMSIVSERETGTLQQINVTPIKSFTYILSKVIPFWIIGLLALAFSVLFIRLVYGLSVAGPIWLLFLVSFAFIIAMTLFGVFLSNLAETLQQAMFLILFFILILFLVSGLFTPVTNMPAWAQVIAYINPLTYFIHSIRLIYLRGAGFADVATDLYVLVGFELLLGLLAWLTYKKRY